MPGAPRRSLGSALAWLTLPAAFAVALVASAPALRDRAAAAELLAIGGALAWGFTALVLHPAARATPLAGCVLASGAALLLLPRDHGAAPLALALATAGIAWAIVRAVASDRPRSFRALAPLALAAATIAHGHRLAVAPEAPATWLLLVVLPLLAAWALARLATAGRGALAGAGAAALALSPTLAREPWWILLALATLTALGGFALGALGRSARGALFGLAALAQLAAGYPWLRAAPLAALADGLAGAAARPRSARLLGPSAVVLTAAQPRVELALGGATVGELVVESYLTNSAGLPCATPIATLTLAGEGGALAERLAIGRDSAEWAAGRPDVAAALACPPPAAFRSWFPTAGRFLGRTYRASFRVRPASAPERLIVERDPALPPAVELALFSLEARW